jgi:hypothetical protein
VSESAVCQTGWVWFGAKPAQSETPVRAAAKRRPAGRGLGYATMTAEAIETKFRTVVEAIAGVSAQFRTSSSVRTQQIQPAAAVGATQRGESNRVLPAIPGSALFVEPANYSELCRWSKA